MLLHTYKIAFIMNFHSLFRQGFTAVEHKRTLVEALGILSSRLNTFSTSQMAVKNLSRLIFYSNKYFLINECILDLFFILLGIYFK